MKIFCVGIGGIGLSAVAQILKHQGNDVSGSDSSPSEITEQLNKSGIEVTTIHNEENISDTFDLLIYSEAVPKSNPERNKAKEIGVESISYAQSLGRISKGMKAIAITGTHGKTTVTGMMTSVFHAANMDPTIVIGSKMNVLDNQNFRVGNSKLFLAEACEYRDNFLHLSPDVLLINNLEPDHLDYFKDANKYYSSFQQLAEKMPPEGQLILFEKDKAKLDLGRIKARTILISEESCREETFVLKVPGKHNRLNARAAEVLSKSLDISPEAIKSGLESFRGTWRRFEFKGEVNGAKVYDDYGHHPTEIRATIQGAREWYSDKRLVVIFQPHQYSRTRHFFEDFKQAFEGCNEVWITDIYQARDTEEDVSAVSAETLVEAIEGPDALYIGLDQIPNQIQKTADPNTVFLVMGAGNIHSVFTKLTLDNNEKENDI